MNLYAQWIKAVFVAFDSNGGTDVPSQAIKPGEKAIFPPVPTLPDHALLYWSDNQDLSTEFNFDTVLNANKTLYAKWKQITATLTFESNGGSEVKPIVVTYGHKTLSPISKKDGYTLAAWCTDIDLTNEFYFSSTPCTQSITLYAKWVPAILTVSFDSDGGSDVESQNVVYDGLAVYPETPVKTGNTFIWWQYRITVTPERTEEITVGEGEEKHTETIVIPAVYEFHQFDFGTPIKESMVLYAKWFAE